MLRIIVVVLGAVCLAGGIALTAAIRQAWPAGVEIGAFGALVLVGSLFERHYRGRRAAAGARLEKTGERFIDPATGKLTEVFYDPGTGEREYREV